MSLTSFFFGIGSWGKAEATDQEGKTVGGERGGEGRGGVRGVK